MMSTFDLYSKINITSGFGVLGPRIKFNDRSLQVWTVGLDIQRDQWQYCLLVAEIVVTRFPFWGFSLPTRAATIPTRPQPLPSSRIVEAPKMADRCGLFLEANQ